MTERIDPWASYVYEPEGSIWANEPAFVLGIPPHEWERAANTLHALGEFHARGVIVGGEALDVALLDAEERVRMQPLPQEACPNIYDSAWRCPTPTSARPTSQRGSFLRPSRVVL